MSSWRTLLRVASSPGDAEVGDAGAGGVGERAAEVFMSDLFTGDGADHVGAGDVHLAGALDHEDEVHDRGGVDAAAGGGSAQTAI